MELLKGECNFLRHVFFMFFPDLLHINNIKDISNFQENLWRYLQVKVHHRYQWHWQLGIFSTGNAGVNDKFAAGVNDTGGKLPVENNGNNIRLLTP